MRGRDDTQAGRRREAKRIADELERRAEGVAAHLLTASALLARAAPAAAAQLLQDLDQAIERRPDLGRSLRPLRAAVAADLSRPRPAG